MDAAVRLVHLNAVMRQAVKLIRGVQLTIEEGRFRFAVFSAISWFKVRERGRRVVCVCRACVCVACVWVCLQALRGVRVALVAVCFFSCFVGVTCAAASKSSMKSGSQ